MILLLALGEVNTKVSRKPEETYRHFFPEFMSRAEKDCTVTEEGRAILKTDISHYRAVTFWVENKGGCSVACRLEMSPDGETWCDLDGVEHVVLPGKVQVLVPQYFLRFVRLVCRLYGEGEVSAVDAWIQGQR